MKSNELRLNNWVINRLGDEAQVSQLHKSYGNHNEWKPIPLTEEWLYRFGFEQMGSYEDANGFYRDLSIEKSDRLFGVSASLQRDSKSSKEEIYFFEYESCGIRENELKIEYVHSLQNLYFALTGEELELKE